MENELKVEADNVSSHNTMLCQDTVSRSQDSLVATSQVIQDEPFFLENIIVGYAFGPKKVSCRFIICRSS